MSAGMLGGQIYFMAVGWTTHSRCTYMLLVVGPHICQLAHLEHGYILWLLAGLLIAGHIYVGWHAWSMDIFYCCQLNCS